MMLGQTFLSVQSLVALVNNLANDFFSAQGSLSLTVNLVASQYYPQDLQTLKLDLSIISYH